MYVSKGVAGPLSVRSLCKTVLQKLNPKISPNCSDNDQTVVVRSLHAHHFQLCSCWHRLTSQLLISPTTDMDSVAVCSCAEHYFVLHVLNVHRLGLQAPPLYPFVPTCQSMVIAILKEQYQAAEL